MKPQAITKAKTRIAGAEKAFQEMREARDLDALQLAWTSLLIHTQAIYSILKQGASEKSKAWIDSRFGERRSDPLLRYMHHARNSDEHGVQDQNTLLQFGPKLDYDPKLAEDFESILIFKDDEDPSRSMMAFQRRDGSVFLPKHIYHRPVMLLNPVTNEKYGDSFDPPKSHLGQPLEDESAHGVALLCLSYMRQMVAEASDF